ncbi:hypothetical protein [Ammoniphilus sp. CFH 90114]|uniref:hypothetical protein n=1 Tax=Ammoniphilus sp. CFH 90114 TaxID=2493665 RepID=UPI00100DD0C3|nr:hypothetical protein [Ammoniphilus sp. CFH 90114]RXT00987.1 hypothetical protein EIZ39_25685 [Ammoniphilus sp. CFH 90114]
MSTSSSDHRTCLILAYQVATLTYPDDSLLDLLSEVDFRRALELLLILRSSPRPVRNPLAFLRRAISENWTPTTIPRRIDRKRAALEERLGTPQSSAPYHPYNWLED